VWLGTYDTPEGYDEDDLMAELDALEEYISEEEAPAWLSSLPDTQTAAVPPSTQAVPGQAVPMNI
jgi:hypothetical protein